MKQIILILSFFCIYEMEAQNTLTIKVHSTEMFGKTHTFKIPKIFNITPLNPLHKLTIDSFENIPFILEIKQIKVERNNKIGFAYLIKSELEHEKTETYTSFCPEVSEYKQSVSWYPKSSSKSNGYTIGIIHTCDTHTLEKIEKTISEEQYTLKIASTSVRHNKKEVKANWPTELSNITGQWSDTVYGKNIKSKHGPDYTIGLTYRIDRKFFDGKTNYTLQVICVKQSADEITTLTSHTIDNIESVPSRTKFIFQGPEQEITLYRIMFRLKKK